MTGFVRRAGRRGHLQGCTFVHILTTAFECDRAKARANITRHRVDLADAVVAFKDPLAVTISGPDAYGEQRHVTLGIDATGRHLVIVFTDRGRNIRLVSARLATPRERKPYEG